MPKPVKSSARVTAGAGTIFALGVLFSCCGCSQPSEKLGPSDIARQVTPNPPAVPAVGANSRSFHIDYPDDPPRKIVFIVDRSGSMTDAFDFVKYALKRCVAYLNESEDWFHIISFSSGSPVEMPPRRLVNATERNRWLAMEFIDTVIAEGETDPSEALRRAFAVGPDTILLLTDGEFAPEVAHLVKDLNKDGKVKVHTIGFLYKTGEAILKQIAAENGGTYKFVTEADLANLAK
ncbi:MAG: VWA domain-containing protein [Planctomycetes bacterium]|nr:VWA domain-containing protein [Planctomycetota bacterium]